MSPDWGCIFNHVFGVNQGLNYYPQPCSRFNLPLTLWCWTLPTEKPTLTEYPTRGYVSNLIKKQILLNFKSAQMFRMCFRNNLSISNPLINDFYIYCVHTVFFFHSGFTKWLKMGGNCCQVNSTKIKHDSFQKLFLNKYFSCIFSHLTYTLQLNLNRAETKTSFSIFKNHKNNLLVIWNWTWKNKTTSN